MTENNIPVKIERTPEGYIAKVGKVQTGPLPTLKEAKEEAEALKQIATPKPSAGCLLAVILATAAGSTIGAGFLSGWDFGAMVSAFMGGFLVTGVLAALFLK